ncbi:UNVERIFIED_ORG: diaminohydroxyphosphoribosylaminopyrimidine deaminase/5-amino-6-(5-phosphoribosylamino)uracil reductase [Gordonia westfalica J30]
MDIAAAMVRAVEASYAAMGVSSPNPPVGAVILAADGTVAGVGATQPPGGPHAEVMALGEAGEAARGGTAIVTLEPCNHTGRTGPCSQALIEAGVAEVHYAVSDPNPVAAGGADTLRAAGIRVTGGVAADVVENGPLRPWLTRQRLGRPMVTAKIAAGIDGRIAAPDGTSQWITGPAARDHAHEQRSRLDAIVIGTGTALADNPTLTARTADGGLYPHQPARVVLGHRDLPADANLRGDTGGPLVQVDSHDPADVLAALPDALWGLVEGGPHILGAFFAADLVDEVHAYVAPMVLGAGRSSVEIPGVTTLGDARRFETREVTTLGNDVLVTLARSVRPSAQV